jgi:MFS family permease
MLALLALAELLGMSVWFAASALGPQLAERWQLSPSEVGWLTTAVQLGFVLGTALAAVLNIADVVSSRAYFATAAVAAAAANLALLVAPTFATAMASRFFVGVCLAGVYPPVMKMASTWFRAERGLAIGTVVGALTVGKAIPYLVHALRETEMAPVLWSSSCGAAIAAALVLLVYRDGPYPFPRRPFEWGLVATVFRQGEWRRVTGSYLGHMWELYSYWAWIAAFLTASAASRAADGLDTPSSRAIGLFAFGAIAIGGAGAVWGGWKADRIGHARLVMRALTASGACALLIGLFYGSSFWLLVPVAWTWGFWVIADSAQFSTLVTRAVPAHAVGTALTLQTSLGFLLTIVTIQLVPLLAQQLGWRSAFVILAIGPAVGIALIRRLVVHTEQ